MEPLLCPSTFPPRKTSTKSTLCSQVSFQAPPKLSPAKPGSPCSPRSLRRKKVSEMLLIKLELKLYKNIPTNGLVLFCGVISMDDGKTEKKITLDLEPFKPINVFSYKCQNKFHTEPLEALLEDDEKFGFMIVDGNGVLYATLQGNNKEVLQRVMVSLPKKHGRGGQSAVRFARIREEKRHNYVRKCCELLT